MIVLYYDMNDRSGWTPEYLYKFKNAISEVVDDKILLIPKNIDVVLDAPIEHLVALRDYVDKAIEEKENK